MTTQMIPIQTYKVITHKADEGGYWAEVIDLPGCVSQGETPEELLENIREAILAVLYPEEGTAHIKLQLEPNPVATKDTLIFIADAVLGIVTDSREANKTWTLACS